MPDGTYFVRDGGSRSVSGIGQGAHSVMAEAGWSLPALQGTGSLVWGSGCLGPRTRTRLLSGLKLVRFHTYYPL